MARNLTVEIVGDARSLERAFKKSTKSADTFGRSIDKTAKRSKRAFAGIASSLGIAFGGAAAVAGIRSAALAASDLEQQVSKTDVVFGRSAAAVEDWSETLATSFGLSRREALTTASGFGALFAPIGLTGEAAAEQSKKLTELGADLASFYNTDVASALDALRSGLVGESEPLRRYGVLLTETRVATEAMAQTGKDNAKQLTAQEKVLARVALIYKDSAQAQGDFGRTSETAANQLKIFEANMENLQAALGQKLIPALTGVVTWLNTLGPAFRQAWTDAQLFFIGLERFVKRDFLRFLEPFSHLPFAAGDWARELKDDVRAKIDALDRASAELRAHAPAGILGPITAADVQRSGAATAAAVAATAATSKRERAANQAFRQLMQERAAFAVERAEATETLADDLAALNRYNALLAKRIRGGHSTLELEREQFQVQQQIADVLQQQAEAQKAARTARQFRLLGFGPEGQDLVPGVGALKRQLASVNDVLKGSFLDTKKTRSLISHIRKVLSGGLGSVSEEVRSKIQQILADLKAQLRQSSVDVTRFQKTARGQFALAGAAGGARGVVITGGVHLHGIRNAEQMERELTKRQRQRARQRRSKR